ncbi:MAG: AAA family ATPase [Chthoniobacterales bacterium]
MAEPAFFPRFSAERVTSALKDTPVVMVVGPRQSGKTTLVREFVDRRHTYLTLDDDTVLDHSPSDALFLARVPRARI